MTLMGWLNVTFELGDSALSQVELGSSAAVTSASPAMPETRYANVRPWTSVIPPSVTVPSEALNFTVRPGRGAPLPSFNRMSK